MKYCSKCRRMYDDSEHNCTECRKHYALETLDDRTTPVYLTSASGFELDRIQAALEDGGIPSTSQAQEKALSADAVTGSDKSNRDILVPFNALDKAGMSASASAQSSPREKKLRSRDRTLRTPLIPKLTSPRL